MEANMSDPSNLNFSSNTSFITAPSPNEGNSLHQTKLWVLGIIIVLTILGNSIVILAIATRHIKMTRMYFFILHLSIADVLTAFLTLLPELIWTYTSPNFYGGGALCKIVKFCQMIGPYLSSYVLIMTAIDRYHAICNPLSKCTWTPKRSNIMIGLAWLVSFALCIPQAIIFGSSEAKYSCSASFVVDWGQKAYVTWFAVSNFFFPLLILIYCYGRICKTIWDNFNSKVPMSSDAGGVTCCGNRGRAEEGMIRYRWKSSKRSRNNQNEVHQNTEENMMMDNFSLSVNQGTRDNPNQIKNATSFTFDTFSHVQKGNKRVIIDLSSPVQKQKRKSLKPRSHSIQGISRAKIKTIKLTVVVIVGYIACSAPFICVQLWVTFGTVNEAIHSSITWLFWLVTLNSVVNPWIYMFFNGNLIEIFCRNSCDCRCWNSGFRSNNFLYNNSQNSNT